MAYLAPIHKPSSVRHALTLSFTSPDSLDLIIAKSNRLEIWSPSPTNPSELIHLHTKTIYGKITLLAKLRPAQSSTDHLFIGTDRNNYFTLSWSPSTSTLKTEKAFHDIADKSARDSQTGDRVHIDPTNRFLTLECYEGVITVLPIAHAGKGKRKQSLGQQQDIGELGTPIPVRIPELFVKSTCFIHNRTTGLKPANPEIAILYEDSGSQRMRIKVRELEYSASLRNEEPGSAELEKVREVQGDVEVGAGFLIPLPGPVYGFLVVGETGVGYVDEWEFRVQRTEALEEATVFVAWCGIDDQRYVLADDYGKMYLLLVQQDSRGEYAGHRIDNLGYTSRASTLVYLDEGRVFVGSHQGDSQIIQISEQGLEVLQTFPNIAPILDFTVMDMGNRSSDAPVNEFSSGQARLVTGSGAFKDGSLRSVRSGVGLEDVGSIGDMGAPVSTIFSLRSGRRGMQGVDTLVVGFVSHTRVFVFDEEGEVEEVEDFRGFQLSESTLHAGSLDDGRAVQVTTSAVTLSDAEGGVVTDTWHPSTNQTITAVSAVGSSILLSLNDNNNTALVSLDISTPTIQVRAARHFDANEQISCLTTSASTPGVAVVGFWSDALVAFLSLSKLETITETSVADPTSSSSDDSVAVPRSLIIANILPQQPPTLFVGLADGNVVTYTLIPSTSSSSLLSQAPTFWNRKSIILGTQQPNFALLPRGDGLENVFATCEHPSLIYGSEGRMVYSAVTAESAAAICAFDSAASPGAIAIASTSDSGETELKLAVVDEERTTHVQTLPVHETVRRIAYSPDLRAFGLGTIKRTLEAGEEIVESHFKLVDEVAFQELHTYALGRDELVECVMRCKLDDGVGGEAERFVVGTAFLDDAEAGGAANGKAVRGRILVFEVTESRELKVIEELGLRGACRCLGIAGGGRIVAALVKTVCSSHPQLTNALADVGFNAGRHLRLRIPNPLLPPPRQKSRLPHRDRSHRPRRHVLRQRYRLRHRGDRSHEIRLFTPTYVPPR